MVPLAMPTTALSERASFGQRRSRSGDRRSHSPPPNHARCGLPVRAFFVSVRSTMRQRRAFRNFEAETRETDSAFRPASCSIDIVGSVEFVVTLVTRLGRRLLRRVHPGRPPSDISARGEPSRSIPWFRWRCQPLRCRKGRLFGQRRSRSGDHRPHCPSPGWRFWRGAACRFARSSLACDRRCDSGVPFATSKRKLERPTAPFGPLLARSTSWGPAGFVVTLATRFGSGWFWRIF